MINEELIKEAQELGFISEIQIIHDNYKFPDGGKLKKLLYYLWICEFQKWLREKYNCIIEIGMHSNEEKDEEALFEKKEEFFYYCEVNYYGKNFELPQGEKEDILITDQLSYEQALEIGLQEALKLI